MCKTKYQNKNGLFVKNVIQNDIQAYHVAITKTLTLMGTCFYMMLGMALVSMCINLMQEQLTAKVKWVANEIGLIRQPDIADTDEEKPLTRISAIDATSRSNLIE
ncbi:UNVERIFIED_CONTAM: hypothetical protein NCL1_41253 [Trichonephila clavipes]